MNLLVVVEKAGDRYRVRGFYPIENEEEKRKLFQSIEQTYDGKIEKQGENKHFVSATIAFNTAQKLGYNCFCGSYKIDNIAFIYIFDKIKFSW